MKSTIILVRNMNEIFKHEEEENENEYEIEIEEYVLNVRKLMNMQISIVV